MKNKMLSIVLAAVLIFGVGTTGYIVFAHGDEPSNVNSTSEVQQNIPQGINVDEMEQYMEQYGLNYDEMQQYMEQRGINVEEMYELMESGNFNFGQMMPYIQQMHPEVSTEEARDMYESMHGTTGASNSNNFRNNMGSFSGMGGMN